MSRRRSISAAILSCSTIFISRRAATFPIPSRTSSSRTSSPSIARWRAGTPSGGPSHAPGRDCAASPSAISTWRRSSIGHRSQKQLLKIVLHTPVEVDLFGRMQASLDWIDVPRRFVPADEKLYSWWSYRNNDWRASNRGRRLDHILATPALSGAITSHRIDADLRDWKKASGPRAGHGHVRGSRSRAAEPIHYLSMILIGLVVGILARIITPGPNPRGIIVTIVIGIVGSFLATYGGRELGLYSPGQTADFIGSVVGAVVLLVLVRLFGR